MLLKKRKCQAKNPAECIDPLCPEKMYLKNAFANAIATGDLNAYFDAKDQAQKLEPVYIARSDTPQGYDVLYVQLKDTPGYAKAISVEPTTRATYSKDVSKIESFDEWRDMAKDLGADENVYLSVKDNYGPYNDRNLPGLLIADLYVNPRLRGQGAGQHILSTITKHADEKGLALELVPTEAGDGKLKEGHPDWAKKALAHKKRLTAFYERQGFQRNPFYTDANRVDYLTKEPIVPDYEGQKKFTDKAAKIMRNHAMYIRFPEGKYPKGWLKK